MILFLNEVILISETTNNLRNVKHDCICSDCGNLKPHYAKGQCKQCWERNNRNKRYATDKKFREQVIADSKKYRDSHPDIIAAQSETHFRNETCEILTHHADEHKDDDDRLTTVFIADQLEKFKAGIYDDDDLKLLKH